MKKILVILLLLSALRACIDDNSNETSAEPPSTQQTQKKPDAKQSQDPDIQQSKGIEITDTYPASDSTTFDVGLSEPVALHSLISEAYWDQSRNDEDKIEHIVSIKGFNRLDKSNEELLATYNDYMAKVKSIVNQSKIVLVTNYSPKLGNDGSSKTGMSILAMLDDIVEGNSTDYYDYDKERLYLYQDYEVKYSCEKPLIFLQSPLLVNLPNCNRPYIKLSKEKIKEIVEPFKDKINNKEGYLGDFYDEVYMFSLENENEFVGLSHGRVYLKTNINKAGYTIKLKTDNDFKKENSFEIYYE